MCDLLEGIPDDVHYVLLEFLNIRDIAVLGATCKREQQRLQQAKEISAELSHNLEWLCTQSHPSFRKAVASGMAMVAEWLFEFEEDEYAGIETPGKMDIFSEALGSANLRVVQMIHDRLIPYPPWDHEDWWYPYHFLPCFRNDFVEGLQFCIENDYFDEKGYDPFKGTNFCDEAVDQHAWKCLDLLIRLGWRPRSSVKLLQTAPVEKIRKYHSIFLEDKEDNVLANAIETQRFPVIQYLVEEKSYPVTSYAFQVALETFKDLSVLDWFRQHGGQWNVESPRVVINTGDEKVLEWALNDPEFESLSTPSMLLSFAAETEPHLALFLTQHYCDEIQLDYSTFWNSLGMCSLEYCKKIFALLPDQKEAIARVKKDFEGLDPNDIHPYTYPNSDILLWVEELVGGFSEAFIVNSLKSCVKHHDDTVFCDLFMNRTFSDSVFEEFVDIALEVGEAQLVAAMKCLLKHSWE